MAHANIIIYSHPQYFRITKYSCYTLIVPQLSTRQHVIRVDMTAVICRLSMNTFFKGMKRNTFVIPHANIMMYTCPEYLAIKKY